MRNILKKSLTLFMALVLVCTTSTVALAASKPKAPKKITTKQGVYYDYVKKHNIEGGSSERVYKIVVKSYKKVNGKKVYSKAKIKKLKQAW